MEKLESLIKTYYDFPKKGIAFKDILGIIQDPEVFRELIFKMSSNHVIKNSEAIISIGTCIDEFAFSFSPKRPCFTFG